MFKGINRRWLINTFGVVLAIIILLVIFSSVAVHSLCYSTVEAALNNHSEDLETVFPDGISDNTDTFIATASTYAADFNYKDEMEIQILNATGRVVTTSTGFDAEEVKAPDFADALKTESGTARYVGRNEAGEKINAVVGDGAGILSITAIISSVLFMLLLTWINKKLQWKWLEAFAMPLAMLLSMGVIVLLSTYAPDLAAIEWRY